ncbi:MAG: hypothetical protein Q9184_002300 [Pyrenodesmia sp. 2 TL-2023]
MPVIHFGAGTIGEGAFATVDDVGGILKTLAACGITEIDTAGVYPASSPGASERLLGAVKALDWGFTMNTKIMVTGEGPGQGSLKKEAIAESVQQSLTTLGVPKIGLSNYSAAQVEEFVSRCDMHGWKKPTVYQGQYNAVCGFLTGNFSLGNDLEGTRFAEGNAMGAHYRPMYDKPAMHTGIQKLHAFLQPRGLTMAEAALRWVFHHSALGPQDAVILGATRTAQIEHNVSQIQKGPLSEEIVNMFDETWNEVKDCAP